MDRDGLYEIDLESNTFYQVKCITQSLLQTYKPGDLKIGIHIEEDASIRKIHALKGIWHLSVHINTPNINYLCKTLNKLQLQTLELDCINDLEIQHIYQIKDVPYWYIHITNIDLYEILKLAQQELMFNLHIISNDTSGCTCDTEYLQEITPKSVRIVIQGTISQGNKIKCSKCH